MVARRKFVSRQLQQQAATAVCASISRPDVTTPVSSSHGSIAVELTEEQKAANKALLESESNHESDVTRLLADISSLETAVRRQAGKRAELESELEQQVTLHSQRLSEAISSAQHAFESQQSKHDHESQQFRERLSAAEQKQHESDCESLQLRERLAAAEEKQHKSDCELQQLRELLSAAEEQGHKGERDTQELREHLATAQELLAQREAMIDAGTEDANRLRKLLADAETNILTRDNELGELRSQMETRDQECANRLAEAAHQHSVESKYLRGIASAAEIHAAERNDRITSLESELARLKETHIASLDELRELHDGFRKNADASLLEASRQIEMQAEVITKLKAQLELLQHENVAQRNQLTEASDAKAAAQHDFSQSVQQHAIELQALNCRIDQLQVDLDCALTEKASLVEASKKTESEHAAAIVELKRELAAATTHSHRSSESAAELRQRCGSLQKKIDELTKKASRSSVARRVGDHEAATDDRAIAGCRGRGNSPT